MYVCRYYTQVENILGFSIVGNGPMLETHKKPENEINADSIMETSLVGQLVCCSLSSSGSYSVIRNSISSRYEKRF